MPGRGAAEGRGAVLPQEGSAGCRAGHGAAGPLVPSFSCGLAMASVRAPFRTRGEATAPARPETEQYFLSGLLSGERPPCLPLTAIAAILSY